MRRSGIFSALVVGELVQREQNSGKVTREAETVGLSVRVRIRSKEVRVRFDELSALLAGEYAIADHPLC